MQLQAELARLFAQYPYRLVRYAVIDGLPGFITVEPWPAPKSER